MTSLLTNVMRARNPGEADIRRLSEKARPLQRRAIARVRYAVATGRIRPARDHSCVDCGEPAKHYDHRDYTKPLDVDPVCVSCNRRRGAGYPYRDEDVLSIATLPTDQGVIRWWKVIKVLREQGREAAQKEAARFHHEFVSVDRADEEQQ
jgi:hypothetical protein